MFGVSALLLACVTFSHGYWNKFMETPGFYQGDIQLTPGQRLALLTGKNPFGSIRGRRWPGGKIAYTIESSIGTTGRKAIADAIADYHKYTCLRFHKRTNERNYISFYNGRGCNSPVGMYGRNRISLQAGGCQDKGTAIHEIGHSIGLQHEQCRPDRDQFVKINYGNINGPWKYAFNIERNVDSLGFKYDLHSMMHYSSTAFARRGTKTIETKDPSKQHIIDTYNHISGFSAGDIEQINKMYEQECKNGGGNPATRPPVTRSPVTTRNPETRPTGGVKTTSSTGGGCSDRTSQGECNSFLSRGYCKSSPGIMKHWCPKTCKMC